MNDTPSMSNLDNRKGINLTTNRIVINILGITTIGLVLITSAVAFEGENPVAVWSLALSGTISTITFLLAWRGMTLPGRILLPVLLTFTITLIAYTGYGMYHISIMGFPFIVILAGLFLGIRGSFVFALLDSLAAAWLGYADINGISPYSATAQTGYDDIVVAAVLLFATAAVLRLIIQRLTDSLLISEESSQAQKEANLELQLLQKQLEQRVDQRTVELQRRISQLQLISQVSRTIADIQSQEEILPHIVDLISQRFGIYHTGIFLVDDRGENAVLQAANSSGGQRMLSRGHRLKVGEQGIVGYVTSAGAPRIALDVGVDVVHFNNPDLPETRSEIALPLKIAGNTFGALDLQSTEPNAFRDEDIETLSILADQVAIAIQNTRSLEQSLIAAEEAESAYRQLTGQIWSKVPASRGISGYEYDGNKVTPVEIGSMDAEFTEVPIQLRGQTIGKIKLSYLGEIRTWTSDELAMAQAAAERTALALENARLLEEAQDRAMKERTISEGTARVSEALDIESILQTTAEELERVLGGSEVIIALESEK